VETPQIDDGCPLTIAPFTGYLFLLLVDFVVCAQNEDTDLVDSWIH